jgi:hypothetical protein
MSTSIGCDAHKRTSLFAVLNSHGELIDQLRVDHVPGAIKEYLSQFPEGTPTALESVGNLSAARQAGIGSSMKSRRRAVCPGWHMRAKAKVLMGNVHLSADRQARPTRHVLSEVEGSMQKAWRHCNILGRFLSFGLHL